MGEIITLQFGGFANYVGTHFWNIQEQNYDYCQDKEREHEIESSIFWRADETTANIKYTPRVITVDLKDSKGALNKEGYIVRERREISEREDATTFMSDNVRAPPSFDFTEANKENPNEPPPSPQIEYWSDFLSLDYHPDTVFECSEFKFGVNEFDKYTDGQTFLNNAQEVEDLTDKVRKFLEEANSPQGFQIFANSYDGFAAVAAGVLESMNDEFSKPSITFGVSPQNFTTSGQADEFHPMICTSLSLLNLSKASTVYVPIVMDWNFFADRLKTHKEETLYHTSAVIAASLDTATLNFRSFNRTTDFRNTLGLLSPMEALNIASLSTSFPFEPPALLFSPPPLSQPSEPESFSLHSFIPSFNPDDTVFSQALSLRGVPQKASISTVRDKLVYLFKVSARGSNCSVVSQPYTSPKTFPSLLFNKPFYPSTVVAQLQTSKGIYPYLRQVSKNFSGVKRVSHLFPDLDYNEVNEELCNKAEGYASSNDDFY